jgi:hypothetical protein
MHIHRQSVFFLFAKSSLCLNTPVTILFSLANFSTRVERSKKSFRLLANEKNMAGMITQERAMKAPASTLSLVVVASAEMAMEKAKAARMKVSESEESGRLLPSIVRATKHISGTDVIHSNHCAAGVATLFVAIMEENIFKKNREKKCEKN